MFYYQIDSPLEGKLYEEFVDILIGYCDTYIFNIPNYAKMKSRHRYAATKKDREEHEEYVLYTQKYTDLVKSDIIKRVFSRGYLDQKGNVELEVFLLKTSQRTKKLFQKFNSFPEWLYPLAPEDPCFILHKRCVFQCIAHENLLLLYSDDKVFMDFFKKE